MTRHPSCRRAPAFGPDCDHETCRHWDAHTPATCTLLEAESGPHTLDEIAAYWGISKERVRQLEALAIRRTRHPSRVWLLAVFED